MIGLRINDEHQRKIESIRGSLHGNINVYREALRSKWKSKLSDQDIILFALMKFNVDDLKRRQTFLQKNVNIEDP